VNRAEMAANVGVSTKISDPEAKPLDSWDREDVYCFIEQTFSEEIALKGPVTFLCACAVI